MSHITTCTRCGRAYEESSEETANAPDRVCSACTPAKRITASNKRSIYFGEPLYEATKVLRGSESVSGRLNQIAERYLEVCRRHGLKLTEEEAFIMGTCLMGSWIEPLLIRHLAEEVADSEFADSPSGKTLITKLQGASFADLLATVEKIERSSLREPAE